jgi:hyperosmotically inducible periplasmic protein
MRAKGLGTMLLSLIVSIGLGVSFAQSPDSTANNKQAQPTADQAKNDKSDLKLMKTIRREIVKDKTLSTDAHNIKIVAQNGKVTLDGVVASDAEKTSIEQKAGSVAGAANVTDNLKVKGQ